MCIEISIDESALIAGEVFLAYACVEGVSVRRGDPRAEEVLARAEEEARRLYSLPDLKDYPVVRALRRFYWRIGIDPTKQRPASEALARRVLRGRPLPRINNVVDAGNAVSLVTLVPIGIYDLDRISGPLTLREARRGEPFYPIGGEPEVLSEGQIVLADPEKVLHVFPYRDSTLTMVREVTERVLVVACGVEGMDKALVVDAARRTASTVVEVAGGRASEVRVAEP